MKYSTLNENTYRILKEAITLAYTAVREGDLDEVMTVTALAVEILNDHTPSEPVRLVAIETRYCAPTDNEGARIQAKAQGGSVWVPWKCELDVYNNHLAAAQALQTKLKWDSRLIGGSSADGEGYMFVQLPR